MKKSSKNKIKAFLLASLITITLSGCSKNSKQYNQKEILSYIEDNDINLDNLFTYYRDITFKNCSIVPNTEFDEEFIKSKTENLINDFNFDYSKRFINYYFDFLKENIGEEHLDNIFVNVERNDFGVIEDISFENQNEKYDLMISRANHINYITNKITSYISNYYHTYNVNIVNKFNDTPGSKHDDLNTCENSSSYTYTFLDEGLTIFLYNNVIYGYNKKEIKLNNNIYSLIIIYNGEELENKEISETKFNRLVNELNELNLQDIKYSEFKENDTYLSKIVNSKIKSNTRTRNK